VVPASSPQRSASRSTPGIAFWLILLLGVVLRAWDLFEPWSGVGFKSAFGTYTTGLFGRGFYEHGFSEAGWMPYYWRVELADGEVLRQWYTHHPVLYAIVTGASMRLFGPEAWAVKLPWLLVSVGAMVAVYRFFVTAAGSRVATFAHLIHAVVPLSAYYATLPYTDAAVLAMYAVAGRRHLLWLRGEGARHVLVAAAAVFAGGLFDWPIAFLLPGLGICALLRFAREREWMPAFAPMVAYTSALALAIGVHRIHMLSVLPGGEADQETSATLGGVTSMPVPLAEFLGNQVAFAELYLTIGVVALVLAGAWSMVTGRLLDRHAREVALALALPGPIYIGLFPGRSVNHDFFLYMSLVFACLAAGLALAQATDPARSRPMRRLGLLATILIPVLCVQRMQQLWTRFESRGLAELVEQPWLKDLLDDPNAVLLLPSGHALNLAFYASASTIQQVDSPDRLEGLRRLVLPRLEPDRRVVLLLGPRAALNAPLRSLLMKNAPFELHDEVEGLEFAAFDLRAWAGR
jgi:hypothetical protein